MQQPVVVSRNADDDTFKSVLGDQMAHQFDCVHANEPVPQTMIQLIGCHNETRPSHGSFRHSVSQDGLKRSGLGARRHVCP